MSDKEHEGIKSGLAVDSDTESNKETAKEMEDSSSEGKCQSVACAPIDYDSANSDFITEYFVPKVAFTEDELAKHRKHLRAWQKKKGEAKNKKNNMKNDESDKSYDSVDMWELDIWEKDMLKSRKKRAKKEFKKGETDDDFADRHLSSKAGENKATNLNDDQPNIPFTESDLTKHRKRLRALAKKEFRKQDEFEDRNLKLKTGKYHAFLKKYKQDIIEKMKKISESECKTFMEANSISDD
jgi:hypothetical protein